MTIRFRKRNFNFISFAILIMSFGRFCCTQENVSNTVKPGNSSQFSTLDSNSEKTVDFRFVDLSTCSQSSCKDYPLEPHFEAARDFSGTKKIPMIYLGFLNTQFNYKILTLSASKNHKFIIWT
jgi:hypothetical protein